MAGIDKAAIVFSIAIIAAGAGFALYSGQVQHSTQAVPAPVMTKTEPKIQEDPMAKIADKVKMEAKQAVPVEKPAVPVEKPAVPVEKPAVPVEKPAVPVEKPAGPQKVSVTIPTGSSSPGCETSNACYLPASLTINVGDTVEWSNTDTAAHTVTAGSPTNGPSGAFDSSLVMGKASFSYTFDKAGSYDYFCMVHPWMVGNVKVN